MGPVGAPSDTGTTGGGQPRLRRVLGPLEVTASGVGIIIGAGIYVLLGAAAAKAGAAVWLSFLLAAGLCVLTALSYAELASMYPKAGAEYDYTRQAFAEPWAFLVGWAMVTGLMVASAAIAVGFAHYVQYFLSAPIGPVAVALLVFDAVVALNGIHRSARLSVVLSTVQVAGLVFVVVIGAPHIGAHRLLTGVTASGTLAGAALVFFAFIGFDEVITLAEETRNPTRVIPRALLAALAISTALYVAVAVASVSVMGARSLGASSRPLADVMAHVLGGRAEAAVAVIALITTMNTSLLALTAASRLMYGMADARALPARLAAISHRAHVPGAAIVVACLGAIAFALVGDLTFVAGVTDFAVYVVFLAVNTAVIVLRRREPAHPRPFRAPGSLHGVPVVPVAAMTAIALMVPQLEGPSLALGCGLLLAGLVAYRFLDHRTDASPAREAVLAARLADERSKRVVFVSHCLLNENVRFLGGATRPGAVDEVVDRYRRQGIGIVQMPCPEQRAWGGVLKPRMTRLYGSDIIRTPRRRRAVVAVARWLSRCAYRRLAQQAAHEVRDYIDAGYEVVEIVGVGASPSCGVLTTLDLERALASIACYSPETVDRRAVVEQVVARNVVAGRGMFARALDQQLAHLHLVVPMREHDLVLELGDPGGARLGSAGRGASDTPGQ